ncbi:MAG: hypothetical protein QXK56_02935 [Sulfolobales archaeon]
MPSDIFLMLESLLLSLKTLGLRTTLLEIVRRLLKISHHNFCYNFNEFPICSDISFRTVRGFIIGGYNVYRIGKEVIVKTPYGFVGVDINDLELLGTLLEPLDKFYNADVSGSVVIDIGSYIGDTPLLFVSKGAKKVYAFEPNKKIQRYLYKNVKRNNALDKVFIKPYGIWFYRSENLILFEDIFEIASEDIDLIKIDCEGCEWVLLKTSDDYIRKSERYVMEIHGLPEALIERMRKAGYHVKHVAKVDKLANIYEFYVKYK